MKKYFILFSVIISIVSYSCTNSNNYSGSIKKDSTNSSTGGGGTTSDPNRVNGDGIGPSVNAVPGNHGNSPPGGTNGRATVPNGILLNNSINPPNNTPNTRVTINTGNPSYSRINSAGTLSANGQVNAPANNGNMNSNNGKANAPNNGIGASNGRSGNGH